MRKNFCQPKKSENFLVKNPQHMNFLIKARKLSPIEKFFHKKEIRKIINFFQFKEITG